MGSAPPLAGGNGQPGHSHSAAGLEGPPAAVTWERGQGEREREMGRKGEGRGKGERKREIRPGLADPGARRQMVLRQLDGPPPAGWPSPATSGGGTGPTQPFAGVVRRRTAPAPPGRSLPGRRGARPRATCGMRPGAAEPSRTVGRSPLA